MISLTLKPLGQRETDGGPAAGTGTVGKKRTSLQIRTRSSLVQPTLPLSVRRSGGGEANQSKKPTNWAESPLSPSPSFFWPEARSRLGCVLTAVHQGFLGFFSPVSPSLVHCNPGKTTSERLAPCSGLFPAYKNPSSGSPRQKSDHRVRQGSGPEPDAQRTDETWGRGLPAAPQCRVDPSRCRRPKFGRPGEVQAVCSGRSRKSRLEEPSQEELMDFVMFR